MGAGISTSCHLKNLTSLLLPCPLRAIHLMEKGSLLRTRSLSYSLEAEACVEGRAIRGLVLLWWAEAEYEQI